MFDEESAGLGFPDGLGVTVPPALATRLPTTPLPPTVPPGSTVNVAASDSPVATYSPASMNALPANSGEPESNERSAATLPENSRCRASETAGLNETAAGDVDRYVEVTNIELPVPDGEVCSHECQI